MIVMNARISGLSCSILESTAALNSFDEICFCSINSMARASVSFFSSGIVMISSSLEDHSRWRFCEVDLSQLPRVLVDDFQDDTGFGRQLGIGIRFVGHG